MRKRTGFPAGKLLGLVLLLLVARAWQSSERNARENTIRVVPLEDRQGSVAPYQPEVEERLGAAVAILVDTSGSMRDDVPGDGRPKHVIAREALNAMLEATDDFVARRPDFPIEVGIYSFAGDVRTRRPILPYDREDLRRALERLPRPRGGTAIGNAMGAARADLYRAGLFRKYLVVVTDGENTQGRSPEDVTRDIWRRSEGAVRIHFVAFDTSPDTFAFLREVGGTIAAAGDGAELRQALDEIYQGNILAEAPEPAEKP